MLTKGEIQRALDNGVYYELLRRRVLVYGWDKERAITTAPRDYDSEIKNSAYSQYRTISKVSRSTFEYRVRNGMPPARAASTPPGPTSRRKVNEET